MVQYVPTGNGTYLVTIVDGCGNTDQDTVVVLAEVCDVYPPNVFTPGGDGVNDQLVFQGLENFPGSQLFIYNRWGNKIYESPDYRNDWNGGGVSDGTYYYILEVSNGSVHKGFITIINQK